MIMLPPLAATLPSSYYYYVLLLFIFIYCPYTMLLFNVASSPAIQFFDVKVTLKIKANPNISFSQYPL